MTSKLIQHAELLDSSVRLAIQWQDGIVTSTEGDVAVRITNRTVFQHRRILFRHNVSQRLFWSRLSYVSLRAVIIHSSIKS